MNSIKFSPSILSADFSKLGAEIQRLERAGADMIHIDVMDGDFVPNITIGPPVIGSLRKTTRLPFDAHLMISQPDRHLKAFADAGADIITVHAECCAHLSRTLCTIRELGAKPSVALNPHTPIDCLKYIIGDVYMVLIMTVNPGFGGQSFICAMYEKIKAVRELADKAGFKVDIEVDGGINYENVAKVIQSGANVIVAGSAVFQARDMNEELGRYKSSADTAAFGIDSPIVGGYGYG
jgi:ribulose-phosphate 3-epimerase